MDRSSFPNKPQDKLSFNHETENSEPHYSNSNEDLYASTSVNQVDSSYINSCMEDVCINGSSLVAYKKQIEKLYQDVDFYTKCEIFLEEVNNSIRAKKFTNTSVKNLNYLGEEIYLTTDNINKIIQHHKDKIEKDELIRLQIEEAEQKKIEEERIRREEAEEEQRLAQLEAIQKEKKIKTTQIVFISLFAISSIICILCARESVITFFVGLGLFCISYGILYYKANQEDWKRKLKQYSPWIFGTMALFSITMASIYSTAVMWTVIVIVGIIVVGVVIAMFKD